VCPDEEEQNRLDAFAGCQCDCSQDDGDLSEDGMQPLKPAERVALQYRLLSTDPQMLVPGEVS